MKREFKESGCKEGEYEISLSGKKYTVTLKDISRKDYGYSYFEVLYNGVKIGNHQCQGDHCERTITKKLLKFLR